ncbi:MAG: N-acetylglucosaminyltransferase [Agarilytica sp.]
MPKQLHPIKYVSISLVFIVLLLQLTACGTQTRDQVNVEKEALPQSEKPQAPIVNSSKLRVEERLLEQAQDSFRRGRYTTPVHSNAYDTFHSVLIINPENSQARAGLQAILLRYAELIRTAMREGRFSAASATLRQVELYYPANALLMDLKRDIVSAKKAMLNRPAMVEQKTEQHEEILLSVHHINKNTPEIQDTFKNIAERLHETQESILIFARNDREGRWIYKQIKKAANGYRVRGDIRISRKPKLRILPPL